MNNVRRVWRELLEMAIIGQCAVSCLWGYTPLGDKCRRRNLQKKKSVKDKNNSSVSEQATSSDYELDSLSIWSPRCPSHLSLTIKCPESKPYCGLHVINSYFINIHMNVYEVLCPPQVNRNKFRNTII
ncbi:hypothetical protein BsWGS_26531 [Bradybaena similaris]